jgi:Tfp pilus assembly protein PilN
MYFAGSVAVAPPETSVAYHMGAVLPDSQLLLVASRSLMTVNSTWIAAAEMRKDADGTAQPQRPAAERRQIDNSLFTGAPFLTGRASIYL